MNDEAMDDEAASAVQVDEKPAAPTNTESWLYAGRRVGSKGNAVDAWVADPDGATEELWYRADRAGGYVVGALYRVEVRRWRDDTSERITKYGQPRFERGNAAPQAKRLEWAARDGAAHAELAAARAERRAVREGQGDPIAEVLAPLKEAAKKMRTRAERDAFAARVLRELMSPW